ncbi:MAG: tRNA 2-thiocytidine biosynthesis protein TtcA [Clostridia bacterium]|nr:tRNA 2-thiocytidine biosynthesis protein TtcA [Clostridia bacterium]
MTLQNILSTMRKACEEYSMISDGDKIAVGLSGGKDSLVLLKALSVFRKFSPNKFELFAVTIDMGIGNVDFAPLKQFCEQENVPYHIEHTDIGPVIFDVRKEKNPCSLCSKMRRGALNDVIGNLGCNKLALGHHADDVLETMLLSFIYEGRLSTFAPVSYMDRSGVTLIRPLVYTQEKNISAYAKNENLPVAKSPCPADHETKREYMKSLVKSIQKDIPFAKDRMFSAIVSPERYNLWDQYPKNPNAGRPKKQ